MLFKCFIMSVTVPTCKAIPGTFVEQLWYALNLSLHD